MNVKQMVLGGCVVSLLVGGMPIKRVKADELLLEKETEITSYNEQDEWFTKIVEADGVMEDVRKYQEAKVNELRKEYIEKSLSGPYSVLGNKRIIMDIEKNYDSILKESEEILEKNNFEVYKVNGDNYLEYEKMLKINMESMFQDGVIPEQFTLCIPKLSGENESGISLTSLPSEYSEDYLWAYIYPNEMLGLTKYDECDLWKLYRNRYSSAGDIVNKTINLYIGFTSVYASTLATILDVDYSSLMNVELQSSYVLKCEATGAWTRKCCLVWSDYDEMYFNGCTTSYVNWREYWEAFVYDKDENALVKKQIERSGTRYASNYLNYNWLREQAYKGYNSGYTIWNLVGNYKVLFDGEVILELIEESGY